MLEVMDLTVEKVLKKIKALKSEKSPENHDIDLAVLKNMKGTVALPLSYIFQKSLEEG